MTNHEPCQVCGGPVRVQRVKLDGLSDPAETWDKRICLNPRCETNFEPSMATPTP